MYHLQECNQSTLHAYCPEEEVREKQSFPPLTRAGVGVALLCVNVAPRTASTTSAGASPSAGTTIAGSAAGRPGAPGAPRGCVGGACRCAYMFVRVGVGSGCECAST